jgi:hypothetical protein
MFRINFRNEIAWIGILGAAFALVWIVVYQLWWIDIRLSCGFGVSTCNYGIPVEFANIASLIVPTLSGVIASTGLYLFAIRNRSSPGGFFAMSMRKFVIAISPLIAGAIILIAIGSTIVYNTLLNAGCTITGGCTSAIDPNGLTGGIVIMGVGYMEPVLTIICSRRKKISGSVMGILGPLTIGFSALIGIGAYMDLAAYTTVGCITDVVTQLMLCATNIDTSLLTIGSIVLSLGVVELIVSLLAFLRNPLSEKMHIPLAATSRN